MKSGFYLFTRYFLDLGSLRQIKYAYWWCPLWSIWYADSVLTAKFVTNICMGLWWYTAAVRFLDFDFFNIKCTIFLKVLSPNLQVSNETYTAIMIILVLAMIQQCCYLIAYRGYSSYFVGYVYALNKGHQNDNGPFLSNNV